MILAFAKLNCFPSFLTFIIPVSYHKNLKLIKLCLISVKLTTLSQLLYQVPDCSRVIRLHLFLIATTYGDFWRKFDTTILVHLYTTGIKPNFLILHQFLLSKPCSFYWGLLESSNPDLIVSSWIPSFAYNVYTGGFVQTLNLMYLILQIFIPVFFFTDSPFYLSTHI